MKRIAVIGSGISGIAAAYLLKDKYKITVFEKNNFLGGHCNTARITLDHREIPVDTGFIVFNHRTYPHLVKFFELLNIKTHKSDMSFAVSLNQGSLEYCGSSLGKFLAQPLNLLRPSFWRMGRDILTFNREASRAHLDSLTGTTLDDFVDAIGLSLSFKEWYLYPMAGAIWSTPIKEIGEFPARPFVQFFRNHGLLTLMDHPQWYTVTGGSQEYVKTALDFPNITTHTNTPVEQVQRDAQGVRVKVTGQDEQTFDKVIFASPAHLSLKLLADPSEEEKEVLGSFKYTKNMTHLHRDPALMPKRKRAWASWNYFNGEDGHLGVTYWMNQLQKLPIEENIFVTLNPSFPPKEDLTHGTYTYEHPLFNKTTLEAQEHLPKLQGYKNTWFCGSYQRYGFHEDGFWSALNVCNDLGVKAPWQ